MRCGKWMEPEYMKEPKPLQPSGSVREKIEEKLLEWVTTDHEADLQTMSNALLQVVREEVEGMKEDDRPEITMWLKIKDWTKGYNQALSDLIGRFK